jgi:hypothetical protein
LEKVVLQASERAVLMAQDVLLLLPQEDHIDPKEGV